MARRRKDVWSPTTPCLSRKRGSGLKNMGDGGGAEPEELKEKKARNPRSEKAGGSLEELNYILRKRKKGC